MEKRDDAPIRFLGLPFVHHVDVDTDGLADKHRSDHLEFDPQKRQTRTMQDPGQNRQALGGRKCQRPGNDGP
jgi:hypothetical protein